METPQHLDMSEAGSVRERRPKRFPWGWTVVVLLVGLFAFTLIKKFTPPPGMGGFSMQVMVKTAPVREETIAWSYTTAGSVEANSQVDLKPETAGKIVRLAFTEGQTVRQGQPLIRLEGDKQYAQLQQSVASVSAMQAGVSSKSVDIDRYQAEANATLAEQRLAEADFKRFQQLHQEELISIQELDQKRTALETARASSQAALKRVAMAEADQRHARADVSAARSTYGYNRALAADTLVTAPFSGVIGQKYVALGDYVTPGQRLLTLVDNRLLKVTFTVPERYLGFIHPDSPVSMKVESFPNRVFPAKVIFVDPAVNAESRTVTLKAKLIDGTEVLRPGQFGDVTLALQTKPNTLTIPEEALVPQGEKFFVYKPKNHKATLQEVRIGQREAGRVEVLSGLLPDDRIIVSGLQKLQEGADIMEAGEKPMLPAKGH